MQGYCVSIFPMRYNHNRGTLMPSKGTSNGTGKDTVTHIM